MPLDPDFLSDCLYEQNGVLIDEIVTIDREQNRVVARMPTHSDLPLTRDQRVHPTIHPRHVSGGLMVHVTGVVAFAHFYYVLGLRHREGWTGYGVRIHEARFRNLATIGEPLLVECRALRSRNLAGKMNARYAFKFTQGDSVVYEAEQTALWIKMEREALAV